MSISEELKIFGVTPAQCTAKIQEHAYNCADLGIEIIDLALDRLEANEIQKVGIDLGMQSLRDLLERERRQLRKWKLYADTLAGIDNSNRITDVDIERAKEVDIVEVASRVVDLRKVNGTYFGKCPFHNEDTASFYIKNNWYHCFGCGESGDTIKFIMKTQGIGFIQAVRSLL